MSSTISVKQFDCFYTNVYLVEISDKFIKRITARKTHFQLFLLTSLSKTEIVKTTFQKVLNARVGWVFNFFALKTF